MTPTIPGGKFTLTREAPTMVQAQESFAEEMRRRL